MRSIHVGKRISQAMTDTTTSTIKDFMRQCLESGGEICGREFLQFEDADKPVLLISHELSLTEAPMALLEMTRSLVDIGYKPVVLSPKDGPLRKKLCDREIAVAIVPDLYKVDVVYNTASAFTFVVSNTILTGPVIKALNGTDNKVLWWIHESDDVYTDVAVSAMPKGLFPNISVMAVGALAKERLLEHQQAYHADELLYCIPEMQRTDDIVLFKETVTGIKTFAIVGTLEPRKGQDILLEAMLALPEETAKQCRFVFVGSEEDKYVAEAVKDAARNKPDRIIYISAIDPDRRRSLYENIDCLICASREDPMPMTVAEACQLFKPVICSENTGSAELIQANDAGFIYHNNNPEELRDCISAVVNGDDSILEKMGNNARKVYESYFAEGDFRKHLLKAIEQLNTTTSDLTKNDKAIAEALKHYMDTVRYLERDLSKAKQDLSDIEDAFFWRITGPVRATVEKVRLITENNKSPMTLVEKGIKSVKEYGIPYTARRILTRGQAIKSYRRWIKTPLFTAEDLEKQRKATFSKSILFSISVPLYNTPEEFLREMIDSVIKQTYACWELCLADGSDADHSYVEAVCKEYAVKDKRVKYRKLNKNLGISENTNACLDMAEGNYIALFDHDDVLHPAALHEMMKAICDKDADYVYTDEAVFESPDLNKIISIHFKPDFAPDNLRANNYICHFSSFSKELLEKTGGFRQEYDGSQDHDLILRLTSAANKVVHVPEVLYFWRAHPQSVAMGIGAKEYALSAGRRAVESSIRESGLEAKVENSRATSIYRVRYAIEGEPKVSVLVSNYGSGEALKRCLSSMYAETVYDNLEIVVLEDSSMRIEEDLFNSYIVWNGKCIIYRDPDGEKGFSLINKAVESVATGDYIVVLDGNTEILSPGWIEEMLMYAQRRDVGIVGAALFNQNNRVRNAGYVLSDDGAAVTAFSGSVRGERGYMGKLCYAQNVSAVSGDCMMMRRDIWESAGGFDDGYALSYADIDLCMNVRNVGYRIVWTPYAELIYHDKKENPKPHHKNKGVNADRNRFYTKWQKELAIGDPYYNPNLISHEANYSLSERQRQY